MKTIQYIIVPSALMALVACTEISPPPRPSKSIGSGSATRESVLHELDTLQVNAGTYRCQSMVSVVNHLRHLGKAQALDVLKASYDKQTEHIFPQSQLVVLSVCRILFQPPPGGWKEPWADHNAAREYVAARWAFKREWREKCPLYPIAMSDGVPFFLVQDWNDASGAPGYPALPDEATECLNACRKLEMIPADLPESGYDNAAIKLIKSPNFAGLFAGTGLDMSTINLWFVMQAIDPDYLYLDPDKGKE